MPVIFKPEKQLVYQQIKKYAHYIQGDILDISADAANRYSNLFSKTEYIRLDNNLDNNADHRPNIIGDAEILPLADETFDSVVYTQVLEHLPNPSKAIKEFYRILKKPGYALITVPFLTKSTKNRMILGDLPGSP